MLAFLASLAGSIVGHLRDPIALAFIVTCVVQGTARARWYWPAILAVTFTAINAKLGYSWWKEIGVDPVAESTSTLAIELLTFYVAYAFGVSLGRAASDRKPVEPPVA